MPRSGTSVVARTLHAAGINFGPELVRGDKFNPHGYFENPAVVELNRDLYELLGGDDVIPPGRELTPSEIAEHLPHATGALDGCHAVKMPRYPFTQGLWNSAAGPFRYIVCVRHPAAVAQSWALCYGTDHDQAIGHWVAYNQRIAKLEPALVTIYQRWLDDPQRETDRVCAYAGVDPVEAIVDPSMNHADTGDSSTEAAFIYSMLYPRGCE